MEIQGRNEASQTEAGLYQRLVDAIADYAIYMLDGSGTVTSWNTGAQRFKGYQASEIVGQHFSVFYTEEDRRSGLPAHALEVAASTGTFEDEGWRVRKDGPASSVAHGVSAAATARRSRSTATKSGREY